jgi:hypothetical protein
LLDASFDRAGDPIGRSAPAHARRALEEVDELDELEGNDEEQARASVRR